MEFSVVENHATGQKTVIAFFPEEAEPLVTATSDHPHFTSIVRGLDAGDTTVYGLFDVAVGINRKFEQLGSRYSVKNGKFYRDLDEVNNVLADQVIEFLDAGVDDWKPLVAFLDRVEANPSAESREGLLKWIAAGKLTLTDDGLVVGYKSVLRGADGTHTSTVAGPAVVDGKDHDPKSFVPNIPGSIVEMPRSKVDANSRVECSVGLHVGTWKYASTFRGGKYIMEVHFDPVDAVAVPHADAQKIRVRRYKVVGLINSAYDGPLVSMQDYYNTAQAEQDSEYYDNVDAPDNW